MKLNLLNQPFCYLLALSLSFFACQNDDSGPSKEMEGRFLRIFVSDQDSPNYYVINPSDGTLQTFEGNFPNGTVYRTPSGRFVAVINTNNNLVSFFDSGIEDHEDHVHIKGTPKWGLTKANANRPVHYYAHENDLIVFNDGDGTISHVKESELHEKSAGKIISVGVAHHGAPVLFNNNTMAVTEKDGSVSGTLPERVKIIDMEGNLLHESTIQTGGIHGEASNGEFALFGSASGILRVDKDGKQELIHYPASLGENWLGTLYYGKKSNSFVGFKSKIGLYKVDPVAKVVSPIEENGNLISIAFDWEGKDLVLLYSDGKVRVLSGDNFNETASQTLSVQFPESGSIGAPVITASKDYVYISNGIAGKIDMYRKSNLNLVKEIPLPGKPAKIALMGSIATNEDSH